MFNSKTNQSNMLHLCGTAFNSAETQSKVQAALLTVGYQAIKAAITNPVESLRNE